MAEDSRTTIPFRRQRTVTALRVAILIVLGGVIVSLVSTYGGRRGKPQARITMGPSAPTPPGQGPIVDQSEGFEVNGSREGRPAFTLQAGSVTGFAGDRKLLRSVHLRIHDDQGQTIQVAGDDGQFDASVRRALLAGHVRIEGADGLSLSTGTLYYDSDRDMIFTADEVSFTLGAVEGRGRGLNYLVTERQIKIPDEVRLKVTTPAGGPIAVSSGDLVASLRDNTAVFTDDVRLERAGGVLRGNYVKLTFDEGRSRVTTLSAFGDVVGFLPAAAGGAREIRADSLTAGFESDGITVSEAEAAGGCRVTSGPYTSRSLSARYRRGEDRLELRGEPVILTSRDRIAAQEIDLRPEGRVLEARGEVRTVSLPAAGGGTGAPGFSGGSAVSFQAAEMRAEQGGGRAAYRGTARAWQEGNSVQADEIVVDREARQMRATGSVLARYTEGAVPGAPGGRPAVTSITSRSMLLDDVKGVAAYRDDVHLTRPDATLTADRMDATLKDRPGRRDLDRILATGSVAVKRSGSYGSARIAEYHAVEDLLILSDEQGLAEVVDAATGRTMRGRTLTFDLAGDRILTESDGGRTWITLKPEGKDAPSVEPKTRH
jgi:LPS export ABC transporter protein LptC